MANTAPFIAHPVRRLIAGFLDLVAAMMCAGIISGLAQKLGYHSHQLELVFIVYALYHASCYWLWAGQTPGMRTFDIRSVSTMDGVELSLPQALIRAGFRPVLIYVLGVTSNALNVDVSVIAVTVVAPLLGELGMMLTLPSRQTITDLLSRTLVVNVPPPQPHRAPAAPMYSATDAEFGVRPQRIK